MTDEILTTENLTVRFGGLTAVDQLSFAARRGRITSVIGPNGAGKSSLFNLISGAIRPSSGRIVFDGTDITGRKPDALLQAGLARSFQITNLFFELSVYENLRLAAQILEPRLRRYLPVGRSSLTRQRVEELIEQFQLARRAHDKAGFLSHGEQRRLEIALALAARPRLLLLDEPTQGMSHGDTEATEALIRSLAGELSILLIEHDIDLVMGLSDHVIVMHQGARLAEGTPTVVRADPEVQRVYFGAA